MSKQRSKGRRGPRRPAGDYQAVVVNVPSPIRRAMRRLRGVNWSEVATAAFTDRIDKKGDRP